MAQPRTTAAPIPFVWHPRTRRHVPTAEIWLGVRTPGTEVVERVNVIREALIRAGHPEVTASDPDPEALLAVHSAGLIEHLRTIHDAWVVGGYTTDPGQDRVVPYVFPTEAMLGGLPVRRPTAAHARAGQYCYDTMTLIGPGTWDAVEAAAGAALTAVDLVATAAWVEGSDGSGTGSPGGSSGAAPMAYALCRPPGHHAAREAFGGSCYLNNAAIAAEGLRARGARRVAVIDIDAHHGNGTQAIFYNRGDVFYGSVHVDPGAGWFPHFMGFADETGKGAGSGPTATSPCPHDPGTTAGSPLSASSSRTPGRSAPMRSSSPWAWTQPSTTRRARCGSPATGCARRGSCWAAWACRRWRSRRVATTSRPWGRWSPTASQGWPRVPRGRRAADPDDGRGPRQSSSSRASQLASRSTGTSNSGCRSTNVTSCPASHSRVTSSSPRRRTSSSMPRSVSYTPALLERPVHERALLLLVAVQRSHRR